MQIEFKPGYHEWNLWINNEPVFSFGDIFENIPTHGFDDEEADDFADNLIEIWKMDASENDRTIDVETLRNVKSVIKDVLLAL